MKEKINLMRQLQELVLIRDEHHQTGDGSRVDEFSEKIDGLREKLDQQTAAVYDRLYKKNHVVLAALSNGCCAACGMQVPISQVQQVRLCEHLVTCSSCGRILFADDAGAAHNVADKGDRDEPKVGIARFSAPELMVVDLQADTVQQSIEVLARAMEDHKYVANADALVTAALEREAVLPTSVGAGIAFPHVRGVEGGSMVLALGVSKRGINWYGDKVHFVFLSAIPVAVSAFYLRLMSGIVQGLDKAENSDALLQAPDAASLWKALCKATRLTVK